MPLSEIPGYWAGQRTGRFLVLHLQLILFRRDVLITFKQLYKIAAVIEAAVISNGGNWGIGGAKQGAGTFNPVII